MMAKTRIVLMNANDRIGSLTVITIGELTETPLAPLVGLKLTTVGAVVSAAGEALVVKELTTGAIVLPAESRSPPICTV